MTGVRAMMKVAGLIVAACMTLAGCAGVSMPLDGRGVGAIDPLKTSGQTWRVGRSRLYIAPKPAGDTSAPFRFSGVGATHVEVALDLIDAPSAHIGLACDGAFSLTSPGLAKQVSQGDPVGFDLERVNDRGDTGAVLRPGPSVDACDLTVRFANSVRTYRLVREEAAYPLLAGLDVAHADCAPQVAGSGSALRAAFLANGRLSMGCPFDAGQTDLLEGPKAAFNARVKALLGRDLPDAFIAAGDPHAPLDVSRAPDLKLIVVSALDFKADFSGTVIGRLIAHHAARGTPVRIMASTILERHKDRKMLKRLAAAFPNVSISLYTFKASSVLAADEQIAALHRVHHVKLFATLGRKPADSVAIVGGRNIHDGFLFKEPLDLKKWPRLHTYPGRGAMTLNYYTNWHDLDVAFHNDEAARRLIAHFNLVWTADWQTHAPRQPSPEKGRRSSVVAVRHFVSVPFRDGRALEQYYATLIDAARERIEIVNPYLNLTPALKAAFDRAIERGVKIEIIGRIDMSGDLGGEVLTAVNEKFVRENLGRMLIRDYRAEGVVLHAKILLIDGMLSVISSVNLNNRSFLHDTENGIVVFDAGFYRRMEEIFDLYRQRSDAVRKPSGWNAYQLLLLNPVIRQTF